MERTCHSYNVEPVNPVSTRKLIAEGRLVHEMLSVSRYCNTYPVACDTGTQLRRTEESVISVAVVLIGG